MIKTEELKQNSVQELIQEYLQTVQAEIIDLSIKKKQVASGRTLGSLEVFAGEFGGKLMANDNIYYLEHGRGPTKASGGGGADGTLLEVITQWIDDKGLDLNPYAVTKTIHKYGTRLFRQGGNSGVLSIPLREENIIQLFEKITAASLFKISSEIYEPINNIKR